MFTPLILLHICTAIAALCIGAVVLLRPKGDAPHRLLGRIWVGCMLFTAISSFWIGQHGKLSWIHILSAWVILSMILAIRAVRRRDIKSHLKFMRGSYIGLVGAGVFTLLPFRLLGGLVWHAVGVI